MLKAQDDNNIPTETPIAPIAERDKGGFSPEQVAFMKYRNRQVKDNVKGVAKNALMERQTATELPKDAVNVVEKDGLMERPAANDVMNNPVGGIVKGTSVERQ